MRVIDGTESSSSWQSLADEMAVLFGIDAAILKATVEAESSGRNIRHDYLPSFGQSAVGYGGVLLYYHYTHTAAVAKKVNVTVPSWVGTQPKGNDTHTESYMDLVLSSPRLSMGLTAVVTKSYWDAAGHDFVTFTKKYVGPAVPQSDIQRRRTIYNRYLNAPDTIPVASETASGYTIGRRQQWVVHVISTGESLNSIAARYKTTVEFIEKWNGVRISDTLPPGFQLRVYPFYLTEEGDTTEAIAASFGASIDSISQLNPYVEIARLRPGIKLRVPDESITATPPTTYEDVILDEPIGSVQSRQVPFQPVFGSAPHVEDDEYPAHRFPYNPYTLRIGDSLFYIPPTAFVVKKIASIDSQMTLRSKNETMKKSGHSQHQILVDLVFGDTDQINGYAVRGPENQVYYMDGLRSLLAQFMKNPFLPVRNELLNERYKVYNVAIMNVRIETEPEFPDMLKARLTLMECTVEPFIQFPDFYYDNLIMYPLFRWWYQQLLLDDAGARKSGTYLKKMNHGYMNGDVRFYTLERDLVEEIIGKTNPYILSQLKIPDIENLMSPWDIDGMIVGSIYVSLSKESSVVPLRSDTQEINCFQDVGGMNREITLNITCTHRDQLESLVLMVSHLEEMSRDYRHRFVSGFLKIDNEILNLCGIYYAMVVAMESAPIEGHDEAFNVVLTLRGFDLTQKTNERLTGVNNLIENADEYVHSRDDYILDTKTHKPHEIIYESAIEDALSLVEMYPDLELPTYDDLNKILPVINRFRATRGRTPLPISVIPKPDRAVFADPDFYFAYPDIKEVFKDVNVGDFGLNFINQLDHGNYKDLVFDSQDVDLLAWFEGGNKTLDRGWSNKEHAERLRVVGEEKVELDDVPRNYYVPIGQSWGETHPVPEGETLLKAMCHDMVYYNRKSRMVRAFPTSLFLIVDEGQWLNGKRLWNNYYTYHAIHEVSVIKKKDNPVDLAFIRLSNIYGAFDFSTRMANPNEFGSKSKNVLERIGAVYKNLFLDIDSRVVQERTQLLDHIKLKQGARIHIRMGYSACADGLPVTFNGHIASINDGDEIEMVCQSDGAELVNQTVCIDPSGRELRDGNGLPAESWNAFQQVLAARASHYWFSVSEDLALLNNQDSLYGIEHFGFVKSTATEGFFPTMGDFLKYMTSNLFNNYKIDMNTYDVMKNVYLGRWDGFPETDNTMMVWDNESNLSLNGFGKTPWDIFQAHALFHPEYVCYPHNHGFRSTVFFGMPHWMVKYGYHRKNKAGDVGDANNYHEIAKPFQQFHVIQSDYDIIHNNIQASGELLKHIGIGVYTKGRGGMVTTTPAIYADRSMRQDVQKTTMIDTSVKQNLFGPEWLYDATRATLGWTLDVSEMVFSSATTGWGSMMKVFGVDEKKVDSAVKYQQDWAKETFNKDDLLQPGFVQAVAVTIGSLQRHMMEMYQGELVIMGAPAIKPWDLFYLADSHNLMTGTAVVGEVSHTISTRSGFTTVIKPDLCVTRSEGASRNKVIQLCTRMGSLVAAKGSQRIMMSRAAKVLAGQFGGGTAWSLKKMGKWFSGVGKFSTDTGKVGLFTRGLRLSKMGVTKVGDAAKLLKPAQLLKVLKANIVLSLATGFLTQWIEDFLRREFQYNNVLYIFPLWKADKPFVAGIAGAKYLIPNYVEPEWMDYNDIKGIDTSSRATLSNNVSDPTSSSGVVAPVSNVSIVSRFGKRDNEFHKGLDFAPVPGQLMTTELYAIANGTVVEAKETKGSMGNYITIRHRINGEIYTAVYMHLKSFAVRSGPVKAGDKIGVMGNTGDVRVGGKSVTEEQRRNGAGTHLHLEISRGDSRAAVGSSNLLDPEIFLRGLGVKI